MKKKKTKAVKRASKPKAKKKPAAKRSKSLPASATSYVYQVSPDHIFRDGAEGTVLIINVQDLNSMYRIDAWAAKLWKLIDGKRDLGQIGKKLAAASRVDEKIIVANVKKSVTQLLNYGLVKRVK